MRVDASPKRLYDNAAVSTATDEFDSAHVEVTERGVFVTDETATYTFHPRDVHRISVDVTDANGFADSPSPGRAAGVVWASGVGEPYREALANVVLLDDGWIRVFDHPDDADLTRRRISDSPPSAYHKIEWTPTHEYN